MQGCKILVGLMLPVLLVGQTPTVGQYKNMRTKKPLSFIQFNPSIGVIQNANFSYVCRNVHLPTITQTPDVPLCADQYNTATLTANTTCPPLSYAWNTGAATSAINVNLSGTYTVTVTYQCGYTATATQQVYNCCDGTYRIDGPYVLLSSLSSSNYPFLDNSTSDATMYSNMNCNTMSDPGMLAINGRLIIDKNLEIAGMEIVMGPNSEIVVKNGFTLKNNFDPTAPPQPCNYFHGCDDYMWQGIILEGSTANNNALQFILSPVYIEDAKQAIRADNNAKFTVNNVLFNKNNVSMHVTPNGNLANNSTITNCKIQCNDWNTLAPQTCIRPYVGKRSYAGVKANNILSMTIGDEFNLNNKNYFRNQDTGIVVINSAADIYNNAFLDATLNDPLDQGLENGIGVSAVGSKNKQSTINVGKQGIGANSFDNLWCGIRSRLYSSQATSYNTFNNVGYVDFISSHRNMSIEINNNVASNFYAGVFGGDMSKPIMCHVHNNTFNPNNTTSFTAVRLGASNGIEFKCIVNNNSIKNCKYAINILNATRAIVNTNVIDITTNYSQFFTTHVGIAASWCNKIIALDNTFTWSGAPTVLTATHQPLVKAFKINSCPAGNIEGNINNMAGTGFETIGTCPALQYLCNYNNNGYTGFFMINTTLPDMIKAGLNEIRNDNEWNLNQGPNRIDGFGNKVFWYWDGVTGGYDPMPAPANLIQPKLVNSITYCHTNASGNEDEMIDRIINDSINYDFLEEENRFEEDEFAYNEMYDNPTLNGGSNSTARMQFRIQLDPQTIGLLYRVRQAILNEDFALAKSINDSIDDTRLVAQNKKIVNEIYLRCFATNSMPLDSTDKYTLFAIASTTSLLGGDAVLWARSLLGIEYEDTYNNLTRQSQTSPFTDKWNTKVEVIPNPTNGKVVVHSNSAINTIYVYDALLQKQTVPIYQMDKTTYQIDLSVQSNACFLIKVIFPTHEEVYKIFLIK